MIFAEKTPVIYKQMYGVIAFVCDQYVVIETNKQLERNPARLLVFRENYKSISIIKESTK